MKYKLRNLFEEIENLEGESPGKEIHIFDFNEEIYGHRIEVEFYQKIREERKFENLNKLKEQINLDIEETRKYFS